MLKRRRPDSPSPFTSSIPLVEDPLPAVRRDVKRRRPTIDEKSREWATESNQSEDKDEDDGNGQDESEQNDDTAAGATPSTDYKQANNVLYELHALHQHRLLFASAHPSGPRSFHSQCILEPPPPIDSVSIKAIAAVPHPEAPPVYNPTSSAHSITNSSTEEVQRVTQQYEDTNRFIGSLFLSRRRQLDAT